MGGLAAVSLCVKGACGDADQGGAHSDEPYSRNERGGGDKNKRMNTTREEKYTEKSVVVQRWGGRGRKKKKEEEEGKKPAAGKGQAGRYCQPYFYLTPALTPRSSACRSAVCFCWATSCLKNKEWSQPSSLV